MKRALRSESRLWSGYALPPPALRPLILVVADRSSQLSPGTAHRKDLAPGTIRSIIKQCQLTEEEFVALL